MMHIRSPLARIGMIMLAVVDYALSSELCVRVVDPSNYALSGATVTIFDLSGRHLPEQTDY